MIQRSISSIALATLTLTAALTLGGCAATGTQATAPAATPAAAVGQNPELTTLKRLVQQAGLEAALQGPVTVFAPNDEAFKAVPAATLDKLAKDPEALKALLNYHVLPTVVKSKDITGGAQVVTANGAKVSVSKAGDFVTVDDALVIAADQPAGAGVVHVIDRVLTPPKK
ncbi:MAG: fasciclin domain-containing protein [Aquabacterium sp.]